MRFINFNSLANRESYSLKRLIRRSIVTSCRAVVVPRFGGPEVLEIRPHVKVPDLKPTDVLVRTRAVSINPLDTRMRAGYGRSIFEAHLPLILGRDISGEVAAVGVAVKTLAVGQEVFGALHPTAVRGTYMDYAILPQDELTAKPTSVGHVEASAIPFAALTAWRALKSTARITEGYDYFVIILSFNFFYLQLHHKIQRQRILVIGGGGAVGLSAIQISVATGCSVATTCGPKSIDRVLEAGAAQAVDYTSQNLDLALKGEFDAVLDTIGAHETERIGIKFLKRGGHYMTLQGESAAMSDRYGLLLGLPLSVAVLVKKQIEYRYSNGIGYWWTYMRDDKEGLEEICRLCNAGKFKIPVEKTFPVTEVKEAHEAKDKKKIFGKVVLEFD
ncbi:Alcohol dehydrogenase, N-terminal [Dillenia turbinata]|uniref:Alcohol dehydrogenase, N-terminal n=1 Tax=Dillenia turbinata TaxID=194707 RepID=A0AAN8VVI5_9MAGN